LHLPFTPTLVRPRRHSRPGISWPREKYAREWNHHHKLSENHLLNLPSKGAFEASREMAGAFRGIGLQRKPALNGSYGRLISRNYHPLAAYRHRGDQ